MSNENTETEPETEPEALDALTTAVREALADTRLRASYKELIRKLDAAREVALEEGRASTLEALFEAADLELPEEDPAAEASGMLADYVLLSELYQTFLEVIQGEAPTTALYPDGPPTKESPPVAQVAFILAGMVETLNEPEVGEVVQRLREARAAAEASPPVDSPPVDSLPDDGATDTEAVDGLEEPPAEDPSTTGLQTCPVCSGRKWVGTLLCDACHGHGKVQVA